VHIECEVLPAWLWFFINRTEDIVAYYVENINVGRKFFVSHVHVKCPLFVGIEIDCSLFTLSNQLDTHRDESIHFC
jgi:hypothetical protein